MLSRPGTGKKRSAEGDRKRMGTDVQFKRDFKWTFYKRLSVLREKTNSPLAFYLIPKPTQYSTVLFCFLIIILMNSDFICWPVCSMHHVSFTETV